MTKFSKKHTISLKQYLLSNFNIAKDNYKYALKNFINSQNTNDEAKLVHWITTLEINRNLYKKAIDDIRSIEDINEKTHHNFDIFQSKYLTLDFKDLQNLQLALTDYMPKLKSKNLVAPEEAIAEFKLLSNRITKKLDEYN